MEYGNMLISPSAGCGPKTFDMLLPFGYTALPRQESADELP
jgi:hypothetical protein